MKKVYDMSKLLRWSLRLDFEFIFFIPGLPLLECVRLVFLKYYIFVKKSLFDSKSKISKVKVFGLDYYYGDKFGLASLQRVYCSSYLLKNHVPDEGVVVDVGANVGQFNFFCRQYLKARRVISVEPVPTCFELLKYNSISENDCLEVIVALGTKESEIFVPKESTQLSSCIKEENTTYSHSLCVQAKSLCSVFSLFGLEKVDLVKIDTEGSEFDVLKSAGNCLESTDVILAEMSVFRRSTGNLFKIGTFLENRGFRLCQLLTENSDQPSDIDGIFIKQ